MENVCSQEEQEEAFSLSVLAEPQTCHHRKEKNEIPKLRLARCAKPIKVSLKKVQFAAANHPTCGPLLILRKSVYYNKQNKYVAHPGCNVPERTAFVFFANVLL